MDYSQRIRTIITDKNGKITVVYKKFNNDVLFSDGHKVPIHDEELSEKLSNDDTYTRNTKDGVFSNERESNVHEPIMKEFIDICDKYSSNKPEVVFLAGGGGSGKSHVLNKEVDESKYLTINNDHVKEMIPEYAQFQNEDIYSAAHRVHKESSHLVDMMLEAASEHKSNIVYDATCSNVIKTLKLISMFKSKGYKVKVIGVLCDPSICLQSIHNRFIKRKRYVPKHIAISDNISARNTMIELMSDKDIDMVLYDNNGQMHHKEPIKVYDNTQENKILSKEGLNDLYKYVDYQD